MGEGGREEEGGERGNTIMYVYKVVIALRNLCLHSKLKLTADVTKEVHPTIRYEQIATMDTIHPLLQYPHTISN